MMFLTAEELEYITDRSRPSAQERVLEEMHITYLKSPDGKLLVSRSHLEKILDGVIETRFNVPTPQEPNWDAL